MVTQRLHRRRLSASVWGTLPIGSKGPRLLNQSIQVYPSLELEPPASPRWFGYFRETQIEHVRPGDNAYITLMAFPKVMVPGRVDSLGWGIAKQDGSTAANLLPVVQPSFEWIRLAQRIPVRITLGQIPDGVYLEGWHNSFRFGSRWIG